MRLPVEERIAEKRWYPIWGPVQGKDIGRLAGKQVRLDDRRLGYPRLPPGNLQTLVSYPFLAILPLPFEASPPSRGRWAFFSTELLMKTTKRLPFLGLLLFSLALSLVPSSWARASKPTLLPLNEGWYSAKAQKPRGLPARPAFLKHVGSSYQMFFFEHTSDDSFRKSLFLGTRTQNTVVWKQEDAKETPLILQSEILKESQIRLVWNDGKTSITVLLRPLLPTPPPQTPVRSLPTTTPASRLSPGWYALHMSLDISEESDKTPRYHQQTLVAFIRPHRLQPSSSGVALAIDFAQPAEPFFWDGFAASLSKNRLLIQPYPPQINPLFFHILLSAQGVSLGGAFFRAVPPKTDAEGQTPTKPSSRPSESKPIQKGVILLSALED